MTHISGVRSLTVETHLTAWNGDMVTPDLYNDAFPGDTSVNNGLRQSYEKILEAHDRATSGDITTQDLQQQIMIAASHSRAAANVMRGISGGIFPTEVNTILAQRYMPLPEELGEEQLQPGGVIGVFPPDGIRKSQRLPDEFYQAINAMGLMHVEAHEIGSAEVAMPAMLDVCLSLSSVALGGKVIMDAMSVFKKRVDADSYQQMMNRLPYKLHLLKAIAYTDFEEKRQAAESALSDFADTYTNGRNEPTQRALITERSNNYDTSLRIVGGSYVALREHGIPSQQAVHALYASASALGWSATAVTDYYAMRLQLASDPAVLDDTLCPSGHNFDFLMKSSTISVEPASNGGLPRVRQRVMPAMPWAEPSAEVSEATKARFENLRRSGSVCPIRHRLPLPESDRPNNILAFHDEIADRIGCSPGILQDKGNGLQLNPAALMIAMTIRSAEHYRFFEAVDERLQRRSRLQLVQ